MTGSALFRAGIVACALLLAACADTSGLRDGDSTAANGDPFTRALSGNYDYLARSLEGRDVDVADASGSLGEIFALKANAAKRGEGVAPEIAPPSVAGAGLARASLDNAFAGGARERAPRAAARAQAGYDCWVLNARAKGQQKAAISCQATFENSLRLAELALNPARVEVAGPLPAAAKLPSGYTVLFGFDEWNLSGGSLQTITQAVQDAHDSRAGHIDVAGHTDTSGSAPYNQQLSVRRAKVVREVMIEMGARPAAVTARGLGEQDQAVPTKDGVREAGNRRSLITLIPMESRVSAR